MQLQFRQFVASINVEADGYGPQRRQERKPEKWSEVSAGAADIEIEAAGRVRGPQYRKYFAAPPGRVLAKADYSQIELRIAARIADEPTMLEAYRRNPDLHTLTARRILGNEEVNKADRQLAKSVNFGLLYGMGAKGFRIYARSKYGVELSDAEARRYREVGVPGPVSIRKDRVVYMLPYDQLRGVAEPQHAVNGCRVNLTLKKDR